jgi:hypothetical protein
MQDRNPCFALRAAQCKGIIGREAVVRDLKAGGVLAGGRFIDRLAGTQRPKRCRLTTGPHTGEVRMRAEYEIVEFCEPGDAEGLVAAGWETKE